MSDYILYSLSVLAAIAVGVLVWKKKYKESGILFGVVLFIKIHRGNTK